MYAELIPELTESSPGATDVVDISATARRCGIDAEVFVSPYLWSCIQEHRIDQRRMLGALAHAAASAPFLSAKLSLHLTPDIVASAVSGADANGRPKIVLSMAD